MNEKKKLQQKNNKKKILKFHPPTHTKKTLETTFSTKKKFKFEKKFCVFQRRKKNSFGMLILYFFMLHRIQIDGHGNGAQKKKVIEVEKKTRKIKEKKMPNIANKDGSLTFDQ
mgnify:CR=1 FL=1